MKTQSKTAQLFSLSLGSMSVTARTTSRTTASVFVAVTSMLLTSACSSQSKNGESTRVPVSSTSSGAPAGVIVVPNKPDTKSSYQLPAFQEKRLANGLQILFVPDKRLPYITYSALIRAGAVQDPPDLPGLAAMVAELLDKGTKKRNAPQIAAELGQMGADLDASASVEYTAVNATGLSSQAEPLLNNLIEILTEPTFSDAEIERMRKQLLSGIQRREDNPDAAVAVAFNTFLFGNHPYAHSVTGTMKSVSQIKKKQMIQYYKKYFRPNNTILAVIGNFTPEFQAQVEKAFSPWEAREVAPTKIASPPPIKGLQIELVDKPGLTQAQIRMGSIGIARKNEDFIAVRVANTILGGAFTSRLNNRVRKQLGLTYDIGSFFDARQEPGPFEISTFTKTATVGQAVSETLKVLGEIRENGVTNDEVGIVKGYLKGVFPQAIETPEKLVFNLMLLRFYGIPDTYLTTYLDEIDHVKVSDVNRVIKKYVDEKNMKVVVYAGAADVQSQLQPIVQERGGELIVKKASDVQ